MTFPTVFGKYELTERLAVGGMAEIFKAKAFGVKGFERVLAIKSILPDMLEDETLVRMFVDEARIAVQLSHPNVVQIYELGEHEGRYYIAMEYVSGRDLRQILVHLKKADRQLPLSFVAVIGGKVCAGLDYAHRKLDADGKPLGVVHRDVNPQNILVSYEGAVKLTDFGIAKANVSDNKTQAGLLKGKLGYLAPEQILGAEVDHRADLFALGILLHEMLTGHNPFAGANEFATFENIRKANRTSLSDRLPKPPPEFEEVLGRLLAREPGDRYESASEVQDDLRRFRSEDGILRGTKHLAAFMREEFISESGARAATTSEQPPTVAAPGAGEGAPGSVLSAIVPTRITQRPVSIQAFFPIRVHFGGADPIDATTTSLNAGGVEIATDRIIDLGSDISLWIQPPNLIGGITVRGRVASVVPHGSQCNVTVDFVFDSEEQQAAITGHIASLGSVPL